MLGAGWLGKGQALREMLQCEPFGDFSLAPPSPPGVSQVNEQSRMIVLDTQPLPCSSQLQALLRSDRPQLALGASQCCAAHLCTSRGQQSGRPLAAALLRTRGLFSRELRRCNRPGTVPHFPRLASLWHGDEDGASAGRIRCAGRGGAAGHGAAAGSAAVPCLPCEPCHCCTSGCLWAEQEEATLSPAHEHPPASCQHADMQLHVKRVSYCTFPPVCALHAACPRQMPLTGGCWVGCRWWW